MSDSEQNADSTREALNEAVGQAPNETLNPALVVAAAQPDRAPAKPRAKAPAKRIAAPAKAKPVKTAKLAKASAARAKAVAPSVTKPKAASLKVAGAKRVAAKPAAPKTVARASAKAPAASAQPEAGAQPAAADRIAMLKFAAQSAATQFKDKTMAKTTTLFTDYADFAKGNLEAVVASGKILFGGLQTFGASMAADSKAAVETFKADAQDLAAARTPTEFVRLQSDMLRRNWDTAVACTSKNGAAVVKLANETLEPIADRVNLAVDRVRKAV